MTIPFHVDIPREPFGSPARAGSAGDAPGRILDRLEPRAVGLPRWA